jgi:hypothetical protein
MRQRRILSDTGSPCGCAGCRSRAWEQRSAPPAALRPPSPAGAGLTARDGPRIQLACLSPELQAYSAAVSHVPRANGWLRCSSCRSRERRELRRERVSLRGGRSQPHRGASSTRLRALGTGPPTGSLSCTNAVSSDIERNSSASRVLQRASGGFARRHMPGAPCRTRGLRRSRRRTHRLACGDEPSRMCRLRARKAHRHACHSSALRRGMVCARRTLATRPTGAPHALPLGARGSSQASSMGRVGYFRLASSALSPPTHAAPKPPTTSRAVAHGSGVPLRRRFPLLRPRSRRPAARQAKEGRGPPHGPSPLRASASLMRCAACPAQGCASFCSPPAARGIAFEEGMRGRGAAGCSGQREQAVMRMGELDAAAAG